MTQNSKSGPACLSDVSEAQPKLPKRPTLAPIVGAAQVFWDHPHKVMIFRGGEGIPLMPYSSPCLPQTYIWRRRPFYLLRCFQRALTLGRVQSTNQCAKQPHPSLTSDFSPMLFKTCYLQKQECVLKACLT